MMTSRLWHTGEDADCAAALELLNLGLKESEAEFPEAEEEASVLPGLQRQPPSALRRSGLVHQPGIVIGSHCQQQ